MNYRNLGKTGMRVSEISLGCEHLQGMSYEDVRKVIDTALDNGINFLDVFMSEPAVRTNIGRALCGRRDKVIIQGHIGSCHIDGQYTVCRDTQRCKDAFEDLLSRLETDYIDIGFIHFVDNMQDWDSLAQSDMLKYVLSLKQQGKIRAVGLSSHNPVTAKKAVDSGYIDVLMFSLNPAYDLVPKDKDMTELFDEVLQGKKQDFTSFRLEDARSELYRSCEQKGVAITVMKTLAMGTLLSAERSPLGIALTEAQCINYALTRPAVAAVMVGMKSEQDVYHALEYYSASEKERDHTAALSRLGMFSADGRCMYCNHCLPCPSKIDIASVNKYLDLVEIDKSPCGSVKEHYFSLDNTAKECIGCGACEGRCPFNVRVIERMERARELFGG